MCGIAGFYILTNPEKLWEDVQLRDKLLVLYQQILINTSERGRDSFGVYVAAKSLKGNLRVASEKVGKTNDTEEQIKHTTSDLFGQFVDDPSDDEPMIEGQVFCSLANFRGEPTTEIAKVKDDFTIQPLDSNGWIVAHNGIISNDVELLANGAVAEDLAARGYDFKSRGKLIDSYALLEVFMKDDSPEVVLERVKGSYAFSLVTPSGSMVLARNYRDLSSAIVNLGGCKVLLFSSKPQYLNKVFGAIDQRECVSIPPYSYLFIDGGDPEAIGFGTLTHDDGEVGSADRAIVVCSGGLDSTTALTLACDECKEVLVMHFLYGCKAELMEMEAVNLIVDNLTRKFPHTSIEKVFVPMGWLKDLGGSTLTDESRHDQIATGDTGVETHNEWVPARNLAMISVAAAWCDRHRYGKIYLGLNLEESGAYGDNTTEFYERLNQVLAIGTTSRPEIVNPLANLMKHEIAKLAHEIGAPIQLSWSCYHDGPEPCGKCGPCIMKDRALELNGLTLNDFGN